MICPRCGRTLSDNATFCPSCGAPIEQGEAVPTVVAVPAAPAASQETVVMSAEDVEDRAAEPPKPAPAHMGETVAMPPDALGEAQLGETQYLSPEAVEAAGADASPEAKTVVAPRPQADDAPDGPLYVRQGNDHWSEEPGETRFMAVPDDVPATGEAFPLITQDDYRDGLDPLYDDSFDAPDYQGVTRAEAAPVAGGVPEEPRERRRRRRLRKLVSFLVLVLVLCVGAGVAWYTWDQELWGGVRVPDVVGKTEGEARSELAVKGLTATVEEVASDSDFGTVLESDPAAGERTLTSESVVLKVAVERTIPNVIGLMQEDAQAQLVEAGVTSVAIEYASSSSAEGTVLSVSPGVGEAFVSGDTVTLTVAQPYTVPYVVGLTKDEATQAIEDAGLVAEVAYVESDGEADVVIEVSPEAGSSVEGGSTVTITLPIPYPTAVNQLEGYFALAPQQISAYLQSQGYQLAQGGTYSSGKAFGRWDGSSGDHIYFTSEPEVITGPSGTTDALAAGASWDAVRYDVAPSSSVASGAVSEENARALATSCGLGGNVSRICTPANLTTPYQLDANAYNFVCLEGSEGGYVWVVLLYRANATTTTTYENTTTVTDTPNDDGTVTRTTTTAQTPTTTTTPGDSSTTAVVAVMTSETAQVSGLEQYGGSFADYFAYANMYAG